MKELSKAYGGRVRVRVGALIFDRDEEPGRLLLVKHSEEKQDASFWTPPGGAVEFGESLSEALTREVAEETGLQIEVGELMYVLDFVRPPLHAVSFYFRCHSRSGDLTAGSDPELPVREQFIDAVQFIAFDEFSAYTVVPEGLTDHLLDDIRTPQPAGTARYLGTKR